MNAFALSLNVRRQTNNRFTSEEPKMLSFKRCLSVLGFGLAIAFAPVSSAFADAVTELNVLATDASFPRVSRAYTAMDERFERRSLVRTVDQVNRVEIGITKADLVRAVGQPVSAYGDGSWNFNLAFRLPQGNRIVCQYRVFFDEDEAVAGTIWRRPQCVDIMNS